MYLPFCIRQQVEFRRYLWRTIMRMCGYEGQQVSQNVRTGGNWNDGRMNPMDSLASDELNRESYRRVSDARKKRR